MSTEAQTGDGSTIEYSADGGDNWVKIPEAKIAPVPQVEQDWEEVTNLDSAGFKEFIPGLKDGGEISVEANYTRAGYSALEALEGTLLLWKTTFKNGDTFEYAGYPSTHPDDAEAGKARTMTTNIRVSGAVSFAAGA